MPYEQKEGQSFDKFITQLKKLYSDYEFGELKNYLIKDNVVVRCYWGLFERNNAKKAKFNSWEGNSIRTVHQTNKNSHKRTKTAGKNSQNKI